MLAVVCVAAIGMVAADVVAKGPGGQGGMMRGGGQGMMGPMRGQQGGAMGQQQGMMNGMGQQGMQAMHGQGPMHGAGDAAAMQNLPEPVQMRMRVMMDMPMDEHDPGCLLMLKDELDLTREQVLALNKILADARQQAAALMTAQQRNQLREIAKTPNTGREMQRLLMQAGQGMPGQMGPQGGQMGGHGAMGMPGPMQAGGGGQGRGGGR